MASKSSLLLSSWNEYWFISNIPTKWCIKDKLFNIAIKDCISCIKINIHMGTLQTNVNGFNNRSRQFDGNFRGVYSKSTQ